jgi:hypothetical protein
VEKELVKSTTITLTDELEPMITKPAIDPTVVDKEEEETANIYALEECFNYQVLQSGKVKGKVGVFNRTTGDEIMTCDNVTTAMNHAHFYNLKFVIDFMRDTFTEELEETVQMVDVELTSPYHKGIVEKLLIKLEQTLEGRLQAEEDSAKLYFEIDKNKN